MLIVYEPKLAWSSSYEENGYGDFLYSLIRTHKPNKVVELGTKDGYSAYHIAQGLRANQKGTLDCYDLFENFESNEHFDTTPMSAAVKNLKEFEDITLIESKDAITVHKNYDEIDILHIDLHNTGEILDLTVPPWIDKVRQLIIIEGGSKKRDQVEWMVKLNKLPINPWLNQLKEQRSDLQIITLEPSPSLTLIKKISNS